MRYPGFILLLLLTAFVSQGCDPEHRLPVGGPDVGQDDKGGGGGAVSTSSKQYKTLKQFLDEMFTEQFVQFTNSVKRLNVQMEGSDDLIMQDRFQQNEQLLASGLSLIHI